MNVEPVVRFENVSKRFVFTPETPQSILETVISLFSRRRRGQRQQDLWAVQDVSFEVLPGQALGIIGRNGSGKSTLLKLISRILRPNTGRMMINGRTSALLELGAGFHPDLTGRENIFLNAAVLGLSKEEIHERYQDIVDFSELGDFINMPVKHYSSGMYMRLGFSVAVHVNPDILIVDEILAVGDQPFQTKCIDRIYDMKQKGTTIIMVSHNLGMMRKLCTRLIWLDNGEVRETGPTEEVASLYMAYSYEQEGQQLTVRDQVQSFNRSGSGEIEITAVRFLNENDQEQITFHTGEKMLVEMSYTTHKPIKEPEFGLSFFRQDGVLVAAPNNLTGGYNTGTVEGNGKIRYCIEYLPLLPARYQLTAAIHDSVSNAAYDYHEQAYSFRVIPGKTDEIHGLIEIAGHWE
jgi:ABC-type polysaccharide/polyol phosphate transport system ATPase subunit